jgi:hypothetical protein
MTNLKTRSACAWAVIGALATSLPVVSHAEGTADEWQFAATIYGWLPGIGADLSFPTGNSSIDVSADQIIDALQVTFMGMFDAQKGKWGIGTDVMYLDLGGSTKSTRDLTVGGNDLPADVTVKGDLTITGWVWTTVGTYRLVEEPDNTFDLVAGARMLEMSSDMKLKFGGDIGPLPLPGNNVKVDISDTLWDGIVGFKGRVAFGDDKKWYVPYYADIGTGDAKLTWQAILGLGYQFDWGGMVVAWRYMDYQMSSSDVFQNVDMSGPAFGATFRF